MFKRVSVLILIFLTYENLYATDKIIPYILDGSLVLYFPRISEVESCSKLLFEKFYGVEMNNAQARIEALIKDRLSVNLFDSLAAAQIGIDPEAPVAYVHLQKNKSYILFTVKNEKVLRAVLDNLPVPIHYRILDDFVMFSATGELLEYYEFQGLKKLDNFERVRKELNFNWNNNFVWIDSNYFNEKVLLPEDFSVLPQGDRIGGVFQINNSQMMLDLYTMYDDPAINDLLRESTEVSPIQKLSLFDFEEGEPAIVSQFYLNMSAFFKMVLEIDKYDVLSLKTMKNKLKSNGFDLELEILPFLRGRFFSIIHEFDSFDDKYDLILISEIRDTLRMQNLLREWVRMSRDKEMQISYLSLFTKEFYGWVLKDKTIWLGVLEGHLILGTNEKSLKSLVKNIYDSKSGFLEKLPSSFRKSFTKNDASGQIFVQNPSLLEKVYASHTVFPFSFLVSLKNMEWNFHIVDEGKKVGRRDIIVVNFFE